MRPGENITVERVPSGLYQITQNYTVTFVGAAASTAIALVQAVLGTEAREGPIKYTRPSDK